MYDRQAKLAEGIALFNRGEWFACHEALEELWLASHGTEKQCLHGLILAAAALLHLERGNLKGAGSVGRKAINNLARVPDRTIGLEIGLFLYSFRRYLENEGSGGKVPSIEWVK